MDTPDDTTSKQPIVGVPVYIDERAMLDLLATLDDGFKLVETVKSQTVENQESEASGSAEMGLSGLLSNVAKFGFAGTHRRRRGGSKEGVQEGDRYQTPGSLLHVLLDRLDERQLLEYPTSESDWTTIATSTFVEIRGTLTPNPFLRAFRTFIELNAMSAQMAPSGAAVATLGRGAKQGGHSSEKSGSKQKNPWQENLERFLDDFKQEKVRVMLFQPSAETKYKVVTSLNSDYCLLPELSGMYDGQFRLFGQVTRQLHQDSNERISLIRGSAVSALGESHQRGIIDLINDRIENEEWQIPFAEMSQNAPALQVFPIALYV